MAFHAMGRKSESDAAVTALEEEVAAHHAYNIALTYAYRGEIDQAFAWLDRAHRQRDSELWWIKGDLLMQNLWPDPRYGAFLRKMNLPE